MTQSLNHYEKLLSRSHSNYLAQISIEMTDANNQYVNFLSVKLALALIFAVPIKRINDVLSRLTALGTILIPMNLITGKNHVIFSTLFTRPFIHMLGFIQMLILSVQVFGV